MINKAKFKLKKDGTCYKDSYCAHPELIENYDLAMADKNRTWHCHHKKEEFYTMPELIDLGMYYNVPPEDLVFVRDNEEHKSWPHKGFESISESNKGQRKGMPSGMKGRHLSEESRRKMSEANKGNPHGRAKIKIQCVETGQIFESIKAATKFVHLKDNAPIRDALKNPNRVSGGYHWKKV